MAGKKPLSAAGVSLPAEVIKVAWAEIPLFAEQVPEFDQLVATVAELSPRRLVSGKRPTPAQDLDTCLLHRPVVPCDLQRGAVQQSNGTNNQHDKN
ncbi:hypothetical protein [Posidoniimonas corsicana]|uniref:hypothetical protein n=1 Tax=Posidoniimonas corsicana TaxID=1938618 RepID=UPI0011B4CA2B|nr:hypothetical protein [Posidoniimonas corsicana]